MQSTRWVVRAGCALAAICAVRSPAEAACSVQEFAQFPVTMQSGYRPMVAARINGVDASFIADSGAFTATARAAAMLAAEDWMVAFGIG